MTGRMVTWAEGAGRISSSGSLRVSQFCTSEGLGRRLGCERWRETVRRAERRAIEMCLQASFCCGQWGPRPAGPMENLCGAHYSFVFLECSRSVSSSSTQRHDASAWVPPCPCHQPLCYMVNLVPLLASHVSPVITPRPWYVSAGGTDCEGIGWGKREAAMEGHEAKQTHGRCWEGRKSPKMLSAHLQPGALVSDEAKDIIPSLSLTHASWQRTYAEAST